MVLKLYGASLSTPTKTVAAVLNEKNIPFELINVDFLGAKTPEWLEKQPFGQIPYIDDDGFILYESRAIARYIEEKYANQGTKLIPTDLKAKALFEQAASVEQNNFHIHTLGVVTEGAFRKWQGRESNLVIYQQSLENLTKSLDVYDKLLAKQRYVAGDEITLADFFHLGYGSLLTVAGTDVIFTKPNVKRWFEEVTSRPSWQAVKDDIISSTASRS